LSFGSFQASSRFPKTRSIDTMGSLESELNFDDYTLWQYSNDAFVEAVEDSRSLQAMIESLLNGVQRSHDNMQQRLNAKQEPSLIEKIHLRHIEG